MEKTSTPWTDDLLANPHTVEDKRSRVQRMFSAIAPSYDLNNRLHSFWMDQRWRKKAVRLSQLSPTDTVVDIACGTGDLTLAYAAAGAKTVIGIDFTYDMLPIALRKSGDNITYINGDAQAIPLPDACADVVSIAFGIRNVQQPEIAIAEFYRILKPGGRLIVLEFSQPSNRIIRFFNDFYCLRIMPHTATWISGDKSGAYKYLPMSVRAFVDRTQMMQIIASKGFTDVISQPFTFGVAVCYRGIK